MTQSKQPPARRAGWKKGLAGLGATALVAGAIVAGVAPTLAATSTFNPFEINNGFTIVTPGDANLSNGEIEGSIAAFGTISTDNQNGYPVIHKAAGMSDYTVPTVDDVSVRILAEEFVGSGAFDVSNRDDSGQIAADSPENNAVVKLVNIDGLTGSDRSGFLRIANPSNGVIDLKNVDYTGSDVENYKTQQPSVASYFDDFDAHIQHTNQCLAAMYEPSAGLTNAVTVEDQGGLVFVEGFATDKPNTIDYADIVGKTIKMDRAGGYKPTADAPLVIKVPAGTTTLNKINFEGWSSHATADQNLSRYILLDLSAVSGPVTIDGLEMGAIWAPNASLNFNTGVTMNGQWLAGGDVTTAGGGEIHHHAFLGQLPCGEKPVEPAVPSIGTTVAVEGSDAKLLPATGGTVIDTVAYENLTVGTEYVLTGELHTQAGVGTGITGTATFTPVEANGSIDVTFEITGGQALEYAGQQLVAYEFLSANGEPVAEHSDPEDEAQTFTIEEAPVVVPEPSIGTTVAVEGSDAKLLPVTGGTVIDTVAYENLTVGTEYVLTGELHTQAGVATGLTGTATFTPTEANGTVDVTFTITGEQALEYAGQKLVAYEFLTADGEPVAEHADPEDEAQTFTIEDVPVVTPTPPPTPTPTPSTPETPTTPTEPGTPTVAATPIDPTEPQGTEDPKDPNGGLVQTGADVAWPLAAGALLLAGGASLLLIRRKRSA